MGKYSEAGDKIAEQTNERLGDAMKRAYTIGARALANVRLAMETDEDKELFDDLERKVLNATKKAERANAVAEFVKVATPAALRVVRKVFLPLP